MELHVWTQKLSCTGRLDACRINLIGNYAHNLDVNVVGCEGEIRSSVGARERVVGEEGEE